MSGRKGIHAARAAAAALCPACLAGPTSAYLVEGRWVHAPKPAGSWPPPPCPAEPVHALLAALREAHLDYARISDAYDAQHAGWQERAETAEVERDAALAFVQEFVDTDFGPALDVPLDALTQKAVKLLAPPVRDEVDRG